jgi:hypothetical protein
MHLPLAARGHAYLELMRGWRDLADQTAPSDDAYTVERRILRDLQM